MSNMSDDDHDPDAAFFAELEALLNRDVVEAVESADGTVRVQPRLVLEEEPPGDEELP